MEEVKLENQVPCHQESKNPSIVDTDKNFIQGAPAYMQDVAISDVALSDDSFHDVMAPPYISDDSIPVVEIFPEGNEENVKYPHSVKQVHFARGSKCSKLLRFPIVVTDLSCKGRALVDTGSTNNIVRESFLNGASLPIYPVRMELTLAGNHVQEIKSAVYLTIEINGLPMVASKFLVMPKHVQMKEDLVLGCAFLKSNRIEVCMSKRKLSHETDDGLVSDIYLDKQGCSKLVVRRSLCFAAQNTKLLKNTPVLVPVSTSFPESVRDAWDEGDLLYYDGTGMAAGLNHVVAMAGLCSPKKSALSVLLTSVDGNAGVIRKGEVVGSLYSVVVLDSALVGSVCDGVSDRHWEEPDLLHLSPEERLRVGNLLRKHQGVISTGDNDIGLACVTAHKIELYDNTPIFQRPRRFPGPIAEEIERQCQELLSVDVIEPSKSPWASPIVPVRKKDGSIRMCVDYRKLNHVTKPDKFPIPHLTDSVYGLHGMTYFTSIDLVRGYYQIPIEEESRELTAFTTPHHQYQFKRLSFGLKNAPAAFQREIQAILSDFPWKKVVVYIDDILVMETDFQKHFELVAKVLSTLETHGIKLKMSKCKWFQSSVEFLGHVIGSDGIQKSEAYIKKVDEFPRPTTVQEVRQFLGLVNFQRKFIPHCSEIQKPLSTITGGPSKSQVKWTDEMTEAFEMLKDAMKEEIKLSFPCYDEGCDPLELHVDASAVGAGACLSQVQDGQPRLIAFASMTFNKAERNYSTLERELAAMRWGVQSFRSFLYGTAFVLRTDHQPLQYLHKMRLVDSRLARTLEDLSDFDFVIKYVPGKSNQAADFLSRIPQITRPLDDESVVNPEEGCLPPGLMVDGLPVPGGGDSLFISLHRVLLGVGRNVPVTMLELRELLVQELLDHPDRYGVKLNRQKRRDLRLMKHPGQLPVIEVLLVACRLYSVRICLYCWGVQPVIYEHSARSEEISTVYMQCISGIHFNPLYERKGYDYSGAEPVHKVDCVVNAIREISPLLTETEVAPMEMTEDSYLDGLGLDQAEPLVDQPVMCSDTGAIVNVILNGSSFSAMLDSGAEVSLVSEKVLSDIGLSHLIKPNSLYIESMDGKLSCVQGEATLLLSLGEEFSITEHCFAVVSEKFLDDSFLLGADFLNDMELSIDLYHGCCTQMSDSVNHVIPLETCSERLFSVRVRHPKSSCVVAVGTPLNALAFNVECDIGSDMLELSPLFGSRDISFLQSRSRQLQSLRRVVGEAVPSKLWPAALSRFKRYSQSLTIVDDVLLYSHSREQCYVVTFNFFVEFVLTLHYHLSHIGIDKLREGVTRHVWHPDVDKVVKDVCRTCSDCQLKKVSSQQRAPPMLKITATAPFELLAVDLLQLTPTREGYIACLVCVDVYSKWLVVVPLRNKRSDTVVDALIDQVLPRLTCVPARVLSDNGPEFRSTLFEERLGKMGVGHIFTTPNKPSSNGGVERVNRTIIELLRNACSTPSAWPKHLSEVVISYNHTMHAQLGCSPSSFLLQNSHERKPLPQVPCKQQEMWREGSPRFAPYTVGELVVRLIPHKGNKVINKFLPRYDGPYQISKVNPNEVTYVMTNNGKEYRAHYSQLKKWCEPPHYLRVHPCYQQLTKSVHLEIESELDSSDLSCNSFVSSSDELSGEHNSSVAHGLKGMSDGLSCRSSDSSSESEGILSDAMSMHSSDSLDESEVGKSDHVMPSERPVLDTLGVLFDSSPGLKSFHGFEVERNKSDPYQLCFVSPHLEPRKPVTCAQLVTCDKPPKTNMIFSSPNNDEWGGKEGKLIEELNFWEMSSIHDQAVQNVDMMPDGSRSVAEDALEKLVDVIDRSIQSLEEAIESVVKHVESFHGFSPAIADTGRPSDPLKRLLILRDILERQTPSLPHTRSRGPVRDFPNVQPRILERKLSHQID